MSTNYYWIVEAQKPREVILPTGEKLELTRGFDDMDPKVHIGKRSGAGLYCWDCNLTLAVGGVRVVHEARGGTMWLSACPQCDKTLKDNYPTRFDKVTETLPEINPEERPKGVGPCCMFSWAQTEEDVFKVLLSRPEEILIEDEYGAPFMCRQFAELIYNSCPIHLNQHVGVKFC